MKNEKLFNEIIKSEPVAYSDVWNYHGISTLEHVAANKNSNLYQAIEALRNSGYKGMITLYVTAIGRSGHAKSEVAIYKGTVSAAEYGSAYYTKRHGEVLIK